MGQRHQTFVIIDNPYQEEKKSVNSITKDEQRDDMATYIKKKKDLEELKNQLGTGKKTVLAFHHQWLYGATALAVVYNFLKFIIDKESGEYTNPFHKNFRMGAKDKISFVTNLLRIHRFVEGFTGRDTGFENFHYLNKEEPDMREYPFNGDNNDGISIIDTTTGKYCFMNKYYSGAKKIELKNGTPLTALEYLTCYYPQKISDEGEDEVKESKSWNKEQKEKSKEIYDKNKRVHDKANQIFKEFELISLKELQDIFPKTFKKEEKKKTEKV